MGERSASYRTGVRSMNGSTSGLITSAPTSDDDDAGARNLGGWLSIWAGDIGPGKGRHRREREAIHAARDHAETSPAALRGPPDERRIRPEPGPRRISRFSVAAVSGAL